MTSEETLKVITIQGPTASGKSKLALELAEQLGTEIISADSRQVYKHLDIGTAKPDLEERKRVKHHLIDIVDPHEEYNAGKFCRDAEAITKKLNSKGKIPLIVGGTGFYIKALLDGLAAIPDIPADFRDDLWKKFDELSDQDLHEQLAEKDPVSAKRIVIQDRQKAIRALTVCEFTGLPISSFWQEISLQKRINSFSIQIGSDREELYNKINNRVDKMLEIGLLQEIRGLLAKGYKKSDPGMRSVGYQEFIPFLESRADLQDCINLAKQHTRNYAKRQFTWLKKCEFDLTLLPNSINFLQIRKEIRNYFREENL